MCGGPSTVVGIVSTAGVRHDLCLSLRLVRLGVPVIVTLGVVSRLANDNNDVSVGTVRSSLAMPIIPVATGSNRNMNRLLHHTMRMTRGRRLPRHLSFYDNPIRATVRDVTRLVRAGTHHRGLPLHFATAGLVRNSDSFTGTLRLSRGRYSVVNRFIARVRRGLGASGRTTLTSVHCTCVRSLYTRAIRGPGRARTRLHSIGVSRCLARGFCTVPVFILVVNVMF